MSNGTPGSRRDLEKEKRWKSIFQEFASSGKTIIQFCADRNLKKYQFQYWRKTIQKRDGHLRNKDESSKSKFAAVRIKTPAFFSQDCLNKDEIEIHTPHGHKIKFRSDLNTESLKKVMSLLESHS